MRLNGDDERNHGDQSSEELGLEDTNWVCNMRIGRKDKKKKNLTLSSEKSQALIPKSLRVCLFGSEIGMMENFEEKIGRKTFLECVWLSGEEGK